MRTPALLAIVAILATARAAHAECAMPRAAVFPAGGTLPPHPTIYRFAPGWAEPAPIAVEGPDGPVPFTTRDLSAPGAEIRVTAIEIDAASGWIELGGPPSHRYELSAPAAPIDPPEVLAVSWEQSAWTCSHTEGLLIELRAPGAVAFRARWTGGAEAIVPPDDHAYFATDATFDPAGFARVFLGHVSCAGHQISPDYLRRRDLTLEAIYADGTRREIALPRKAAPRAPATTAAPPPSPPGERAVLWPWITALSAASIAFTIALARRRRRAMVP